MKLFKTIFLSLFTLFITFQGYAQRAKDGNYTVSTSGDVVNTYTSLIANANAGVTTLTVANNAMSGAHFSGNLAPGDLIMIVQMYGADVEINTFPYVSGWGPYTVPNSFFASANAFFYEFGRITNYNNAGKFEQVEVTSVSGGNTINLQCGLKNSYDFAKKVQIIRIPRYNNLTVNNSSSIVPLPWDGTSGGVVALEIETALTVNAGGLIHANGLGFRGGQLDPTASKTGTPGNPNDLRFLGSPNSDEGSEKGEGIFGYHTELDAVYSRWGISAVANGGGGGGYQNAGGGGGSNVSAIIAGYTGNGVPDPTYNAAWALDFSGGPYDMGGMGTTNISGTSTPGGGRGGYALAQTNQNELTVGPRNSLWGGDDRKTNGGRGGHPLTYDATRLFFGGGGGAGDHDGGQGGAGGAGGGIVYIVNYGTTAGSGAIESRGAAGQGTNILNQNPSLSTPRRGNDGAGGGGAGGAIFIENAGAIPNTINLNAKGGDGGNQNMRVLYKTTFPQSLNSDEAGGPGGSGAGGSIAFSSGAPTQDITAGTNGIVISERFNGTTSSPTPIASTITGNFPPNGATNGSVGMGSLSAPYYDLQIADITTCVTPVTLTVTVLGTIPSGGTIGWYTQEFGGSTFATGTSTSVSPAVTTTYYVGVCPGSFRVPVTVTVTATAPTPTISGGPTTFCTGGSVLLTSSAATGNQWSLDGTPIVGATNQTYSATTAGNYTVIATSGGCTSAASLATTVTINPIPATPTIGAGGPTAFCSGGSVLLTSSSATGNQWLLDGTPIVGATNQTYLATAAGNYTVIATTGGCPSLASAATTVTINPIPATPTIGAGGPLTFCSGGSVLLTSSSATGNQWSLNGTPIGGATNQTYSATASGDYTVITTSGGCPSLASAATTVSVTPTPATPTIGAGGPTAFCSGGSVLLTSSSATGNQWSLNGTPIGGATNQTLIVSASGDYTVVVTSGGCTSLASAVTTVTANAIPTVTATNDGPICIGGTFNLGEIGGDAVSWAWSSSGGATITANTDQSPIVTGAVDGEVFTVVITDANICTNSANTAISVIQSPVLDAITDVVNCGPYTLPAITGTNLTGSEAYYDNSIASGGAQITGPITSTQTVWVYDGIATCEDEISFQVTINPLPSVVSFTGGSSYCDGDIASDLMIDVTGSADWSINYTLNGVAQNIVSSTTPISIGNAEGVYVLTGISDVNCSNSASQTQTIIITATPAQPVASSDVVYCTDDLPGSVSVSGAGGTYTWYTDNALTSVYGTGSIVTVLGTTQIYYVTESLNGCESTPDEVSITFENCEVVYPTAFTPDGDGTNDTWEILGLDEKYPDNTVRIYNRWGNLIFEHESSITNPYNNSQWDGTYKGAPLPVGSFYYIIDVKGSDEKIKGTVSIILN